MSGHGVAEAKNKLPELINRVLNGEDVVITRHGQPVAELKPVKRVPPPMTEADFAWLRAHRARLTPAKTDAVTLVRRMRDESAR